MKASVVSLFSGLFVLLHLSSTAGKVFLNVSPNRQQFFTGEPVRLSCEEEEDGITAAGWTLKRELDQIQTCGVDKGFQRCRGATYNVPSLSAADQGGYWCEDKRGNQTLKVTITVSDRPLILDIPALPVSVGGSVTLRCMDRNGSSVSAHFFKYGKHKKPLRAAPDKQVIITNVQKSDKGYYWCSSGQESVSSKLHVIDPPPASSQSTDSGFSWFRLLCHLVVISPYCITTGLLISIHCCMKTD